MKNRWLYTIGLMLLGMVAFGASPAKAATAAGPYYALPSWDQQLQCDTTATCPRFIVLSNWGNAAVLDRETGLVWERSPDKAYRIWTDAIYYCYSKDVGGRLGWRLPTVEELASLVDRTQSNPALPSGHPFDTDCTSGGCVQSNLYWSSTTNAYDTSLAWYVYMYNGDVHYHYKTNGYYVWCVRGGQGYDAY